jgi:hypothetical protein
MKYLCLIVAALHAPHVNSGTCNSSIGYSTLAHPRGRPSLTLHQRSPSDLCEQLSPMAREPVWKKPPKSLHPVHLPFNQPERDEQKLEDPVNNFTASSLPQAPKFRRWGSLRIPRRVKKGNLSLILLK